MTSGRVSTYSEEYQKQAEEYLEHFEKSGDVIPSVAGLAVALKVSKKTLYNWGDVHPDFLHTLGAILEKQENIALNKGIDGTFNSTITKLVLANHGYNEKVDVEHGLKSPVLTLLDKVMGNTLEPRD